MSTPAEALAPSPESNAPDPCEELAAWLRAQYAGRITGELVVPAVAAPAGVEVVRVHPLLGIAFRIFAADEELVALYESRITPRTRLLMICHMINITGQILPEAQSVTYTLNFKRLVKRSLSMAIADGVVAVDGRPIYSANDLKVGIFTSTEGF